LLIAGFQVGIESKLIIGLGCLSCLSTLSL
jgi:hypothetical protein